MLLPLAWLIQVDDRPEYREWLKMIASDMEKCQDVTGAIREELGPLDHGDMAPPVSNETYGTGEAPLIQTNGDCVSDLLYTCNFTFLGLNEAYAATGDDQYKRMADKLADFLIRIQVKVKNILNLMVGGSELLISISGNTGVQMLIPDGAPGQSKPVDSGLDTDSSGNACNE
ncbi:MAG: hypothetical protein IPJ37_08255 [Bacteroidales bacterium]|nr:hypothetical protein [Bacteroidales bacterium]